MNNITDEIDSILKNEETITIPLSTYKKILGNELVYAVGVKLVKYSKEDNIVDNIIITSHTTDMNNKPIYGIKKMGWYNGSHIDEESREYLTTEFGLSDYIPVAKYCKIITASDKL